MCYAWGMAPKRITSIDQMLPGDLVGFSACSALGIAINLATCGVPFYGLSHVAIVADHWDHGRLLFESTTLPERACYIQGSRVSGVQAHRLRGRLSTYHGKIWHYPLAEPLDTVQSKRLARYCVDHLGLDYDAIGAFRSRRTPLGWLERRLRPEDLTSIFCSELIADAWRDCGVWWIGNASKWNPNALARAARRRDVVQRPIRWYPVAA